MIRRTFVSLLLACFGFAANGAVAQRPETIPLVAVLISHVEVDDPSFDQLRAALRTAGYEDGRNIRVKLVSAGGHLDRLAGLAHELVRENVDMIIAPNEASIRAAQKATTTIPIVMSGWGYDPVALGLVDSLRRPTGNVTGVYGLVSELQAKRLEILKEALPGISRVAIFWDPAYVGQLADLQHAAESLGLRAEPIEIRQSQELATAFSTAKRRKAEAVLFTFSPLFYVNRLRAASLAVDSALPTIGPFEWFSQAGMLISYGPDVDYVFQRQAYYVDRLLRGAKPSDLPVEQVSKLKLAVNLKTAKVLRLTIPESILLRADEVIE